jgi:hypothetical protein
MIQRLFEIRAFANLGDLIVAFLSVSVLARRFRGISFDLLEFGGAKVSGYRPVVFNTGSSD